MNVGVPIVAAPARFARQHVNAGTASANMVWVNWARVVFMFVKYFYMRSAYSC